MRRRRPKRSSQRVWYDAGGSRLFSVKRRTKRSERAALDAIAALRECAGRHGELPDSHGGGEKIGQRWYVCQPHWHRRSALRLGRKLERRSCGRSSALVVFGT